jgi:hypothetical protein
VILRSLVAGALFLVSCGTLNDDTQSGALAGSKATAAPTQTAGRPVGVPATGDVRLKDDFGGWSIDRPAIWFDMPQAMHGVAVRNLAFGMNDFPPPPGSVVLSLRLETVHPGEEGLDLETFASRRVWTATCAACRKILERGDLSIAGEPAKFFAVYQNQPSPLEQFEPHLYWLVRSPFFGDRVLVITGWPTTSPGREDLERMVTTIQFFRPAPPILVPMRTKAEVIASVGGAGRTITRSEAKLMLYREFERAYNDVLRAASGGPSAAYSATDPDTLVWVVALTGSGLTPMKGGGPPGAGAVRTPSPWLWSIAVVPAREPYSWGGPSMGGPEASWPVWFDQLIDRGT